jgi:protocatechuate 3,4-dioxygenase beta subunit
MKLALRLALVLVVLVIGALLWWRRGGESDAAQPGSVSSAAAPASEAVQLAPVEANTATTPVLQAREEVVIAPPASEVPRETLLRVLVVSKEHRGPLAGVRLGLFSKGYHGEDRDGGGARGSVGVYPRTGADGRAEFVVESGLEFDLSCMDDKYDAYEQHIGVLAVNETREITLELATEDDLVFCGRIVDDSNGAALTIAHVKLGRVSAWVSSGEKFPTDAELKQDALAVDPDGRFEIRDKSWLQHDAFAFADGFSRARFGLEKGHETPDHAVGLRLARSASIDVLIRDDGGGIQDAKVELSAHAYDFQQGAKSQVPISTDVKWTAQTDANGFAHLANLQPKVPLTVLVRTPDGSSRQRSQPVTLAPGEQGTLEIVMGQSAVVRGRVEDREGHAIANCQVWCMPAETSGARWFQSYEKPVARTHTNEDGRFSFDDVPIGTWSIGPAPGIDKSPASPQAAFTGLAQFVEIRDGSERLDLVLVGDRDLHVRGTVVDPGGAPVASCSVFAHVVGGRAGANAMSDSAGHFDLGPLPAAKWTVRADMHRGPHAPSEDVVVEAGTDDIVLHLRTGGAIRGRVVDGRTHEAAACEISLATSEPVLGGTRTDSRDGTFAFEGVLAGSYVVSARTSDGRHGRLRVAVPTGIALDNLEVLLEPGAKLELNYTGNTPFCSFTLSADGDRIDFDNVEPGTPNTRIVPPGTIEVRWRIHSLDFEQTQSVTLAPGEQRSLTWKGKP